MYSTWLVGEILTFFFFLFTERREMMPSYPGEEGMGGFVSVSAEDLGATARRK